MDRTVDDTRNKAHGHDDADDSSGLDMFQEPDGFRPSTPPPQVLRVPYDFSGSGASTALLPADEAGESSAEELKIHLLGAHPLWGHHLWNASLDISRYLRRHARTLLRGKAVLELGAAAGVPSIVCAREGAQTVVATDYPDTELIDVLQKNMLQNTAANGVQGQNVVVEGYLWGAGDTQLKSHLSKAVPPREGFDLLLLSDLIFNHQAHDALLTTMSSCLASPPTSRSAAAADAGGSGIGAVAAAAAAATPSVDIQAPMQSDAQRFARDESNPAFPDDLEVGEFTQDAPTTPCVLVFFTHHRPHLAHRDMDFFVKAQSQGWEVERVGRWRRSPMFPDDPGCAVVRGTVHGFRLYRAERA
ncbi:unnamed protein product [Parajaminaea phylloscopi]